MASSVMANIESARRHRFGQRRSGLLIDVRTQLAFHHRIEERKNLTLLTANLKLDAAVGQVSHPADHIETLGNLTTGPHEAGAWHLALLQNLRRDHART